MNEMKPEDVMRALEICAEYANKPCPSHCPYGGFKCLDLTKDALALIREKDADIDGLEADNEHLTLVIEGKMKQISRMAQKIVDKDAEIERLNNTLADALVRAEVAKVETITKFADRLKKKAQWVSTYESGLMVDLDDIDQIAKEMKEGD